MNFLEIINAVLLELNYSTVTTFDELTKPEHVRLKQVINRVNKEVCSLSDSFYFRQRTKDLLLDENVVVYPLNINGKVTKIISKNSSYKFLPDYNTFFSSSIPKHSYSFYGKDILISPSNEEIKIFYICSSFVKDKNDELKENFENEEDESIIPVSFQDRIFVNGAAMIFKQNPSHPKYVHWNKEYEMAIRALAGNCKCDVNQNTTIDGGFRKL